VDKGTLYLFGLYSRICGYVSYGKSRYAEKSKERTFPLRLEIPQKRRDFALFPQLRRRRLGKQAKNKIADLERFDYSAVV
jgi:hypothetical protein